MRSVNTILFLLLFVELSHAQKILNIVEYHFQVDSLNNRTVKTFEYDTNGNLISENLIGYKPFGSKYASTGTWLYEYMDDQIINKILVNRPNADTISISYKYAGSKVRVTRDELVTQSKIKDGLVYGDGTENGCIVPLEALEFYKVWVNRDDRKVFYKEDFKRKEYVYFNHRTNPHNLIYEYSDDGNLVSLSQINRNTGQTNWVEQYIYTPDSLVRTREYFITYWGNIPPKETETTFLNSDEQPTKTIFRNSKDGEDGTIIYNYQNGLLTSQDWLDTQENLIRRFEFQYE